MHRRRIIYCFVLLAAIASTGTARAQALQMEDWDDWNAASAAVFPTERWMRYESPEQAGWSSEKLGAIKEWIDEAESAAVMVIYNGAVLAQWGQTERRYKCHSMRKSLLSALYGNAVAAGAIDLEETIGSIGIDDISPLTELEKTATVSDLLKSRSGVYHPAAYWDPMDTPKRGSRKPGTYWFYNNWDFNTLGAIYNRKTSSDLFEAFEAQIARPLQMQDFELRHTYYHLESNKSRYPAYPFRMSARDLARFGLLYLNQGRWIDRQVLPSAWVEESTETHSTIYAGRGYGYMWWLPRKEAQLGKLNGYWAAGHGGHFLYVIPGARLVLVHRADTYTGKHVNQIFAQHILQEVLRARTGPPVAEPKLVRLVDSTPVKTVLALSKEQTSGLTGKYYMDDEVVTVREVEDRLEIMNPYTGTFYLFPASASEFEVEDEQFQVEFDREHNQIANTIRIRVGPDEVYELHRERGDDRSR